MVSRVVSMVVRPETDSLIRASIVEEVWRAAQADWWRRRAEDFEWAKPRPEDFHGRRTHDELDAAWNRCHGVAQACRQRADIVGSEVAA